MDIYIYIPEGSVLDAEPFSNLKTLCQAKGLSYDTYTRIKAYPIVKPTHTILKKTLTKSKYTRENE